MRRRPRKAVLPVVAILGAVAIATVTAGTTQAGPTVRAASPKFMNAKAFDVSKPLRELAKATPSKAPPRQHSAGERVDRNLGVEGAGVSQLATGGASGSAGAQAAAIAAPITNFEGLSNQDNFNVLGFRVNPPDPVGDVGPNHYVEMINLVFAVYSKSGTKLLGPASLGSLWAGFPVTDCANNAGDPIVVYDQFSDRWLLSQFTSVGPKYWNCIAISQTGDPTGAYYRYAFITQDDPDLAGGTFFPDYPKYGVWKDSYVLTTRDFGEVDEYGISVYALEKNKMVEGDPNARAVQFFLDSRVVPLEDIGDGLLPADVDGKTKPKQDVPIPIVGTQDDDFTAYGATVDALNIWELDVHWNANADADATLVLATQLPVAEFDSVYPCNGVPGIARDCLPQPGIVNTAQFLDILSYRQRPTWRLAWRAFKDYDSMVTNQSVEAAPNVAGARWYEIRRGEAGTYTVHQQGTYAPADGVHRWMGSIAQDKNGAMALGYSVVNATTVFPGIRYTGRVSTDPLGQMPQGEGTIINGTGVQTTVNSRWGDYTSMNVDPVDDCTFWYVNEYYTAAGQASSPAGWQTRIASLKLPGC
jgi:hypothetical protein